MNYHLSRQGQTLGTFSVEELQAKRRAGDLTGHELVWRAGMAEWEPLDRVLDQVAAGTAPPPLPSSALPKPSNHLWVWLLVGFGCVLVLAGMVWVGLRGYRAARRTQSIISPSSGGDQVALAGRKITWHTNTLTERDVEKRANAFRTRQWVEGYQNNGVRKPAYDTEALEFLKAWMAESSAESPTNRPTAEQLADKLAADTNCDEPLLLAGAAGNSGELHESIRRFDKALRGFPESKHLAYPKWYATVMLADKIGDNAGRVQALDSSALELFKQMFVDGSVKPDDQREMADLLLYGWARNFFARNETEVVRLTKEARPEVPWLSLVLDGQYNINLAWQARGGGYSDSVSEKGWEGFSQHEAAARKSLTKAWQLRPDLPHAASRMVYVAMGDEGLEEMRQWFDRAVAAQIDHYDAWSNMRWGLRPRWYGSLEAMRAFGVAAVNTHRFDTDVPRKFFDVVSDLESELKTRPGQHIYGRYDLWPKLQEMYEGYIAEPVQLPSQPGWRASYAVIAYLAGHYDIARQQLDALHWSVPDSYLNGWGQDLSLLPLEVAARTSGVAQQVQAAEGTYHLGNPSEPLRLYRELANATNLDVLTRQFINYRVAALEVEQRLRSGEWVDFLPTSNDDPNWFTVRGTWKRLPDGALEVSSGPTGHMIVCRSRVGPDFEVRGEFELVRSSDKSFQGGLAMGLPDLEHYVFHAFRMKRNDTEGDVASFSEGWSRSQVYQKIELSAEHNSFSFRYQAGRATASVNGREVFQQARPPRGLQLSRRDFLLGVAAFNDMNDTVIRYRQLQVRWLASKAAQQEEE